MQACKLFLRILNKNKFILLVYCVIFIAVSFTFIPSSNTTVAIDKYPATLVFSETDKKDNDTLIEYLDDYINFVDLGDRDIDDAIFYQNIILYVTFSENYMDKLLNNETDIISYKSAPDTEFSFALLNRITNILNIAKTGYNNGLTTKDEALTYAINTVNEANENVTLEYTTSVNSSVMYSYNLLTYVIGSVILLIVGIINYELLKKDITRRLDITPLTVRKRNIQLLFSYFVSSLLLIFVLSFTPVITHGGGEGLENFGYYFLNNCILVLPFVALALLVSGFCKSNVAFQGFATAFPLVSAFLTGAMIPQEFIPEITLNIAHIFPQYYTIVANDYIDTTTSFNFFEYLGVIYPIFIITVVLLVGTIIVQRINSRKEL